MNPSESLFAEHSVFAQLVVVKQRSPLSPFQEATIKNNGNNLYIYTTTEKPLTDVDANEYSITNLPDTIAYIPKNSQFDNIILIRSSSPDYRFIPIAQTDSMQTALKRISVASDANIKVKRFRNDTKKEPIFTTTYTAIDPKDVGFEEEEADDEDSGSDFNPNPNQENTSKYRIIDLTNYTTKLDFDRMIIPKIIEIVATFGTSNSPVNQSRLWSDELQYQLRLYDNQTNINNIINHLKTNVPSVHPNLYTPNDIFAIKNIITEYLDQSSTA